MSGNSLTLLGARRFWPLFWTQFSVAFNDNVFKNGMLLLVTYSAEMFGEELTIFGLDAQMLNPISNLLLIAPFVLFSAIAGQISDRHPKHAVINWVKLAEIGVMLLAAGGFAVAALGYAFEATLILLGLVFFMGLQSAFFGPSKYAILPELLSDQGELVGGNALIEMGTYFSVLGGIALATLMFGDPEAADPSRMWGFAVAVVFIAILGWGVSRWIPKVAAQDPDLKVARDPFTSSWDAARVLLKDNSIFQSVLGISWFWALGGAILVLVTTYTKAQLHAGPGVYAALMGVFALGIGFGSIACERLSFQKLEIGLVPYGSAGLSLGLLGLFLVGEPWAAAADGSLYTIGDLVGRPGFWLILATLFVLAVSGGFFMVPLYTLVQHRAEPTERSRVIGANNIVNSALILLLQGALIGFAALSLSEPVIFGIFAVVNLLVAIYIYYQVPEFALRFLAWALSHILYRLRVSGSEHLPEEGAALVVCNHVSFVDFLIVMGAVSRPVRFVMDRQMSRIPVLSVLFKHAKVIPVTSFKEDPELVQRAFDTVSEELRAGNIVMIFPEGGLTWDGQMLPFKKGVERILARDPVPVVPMALNGLWGSFFSRRDGKAMTRPFRRGMLSRVQLTIGAPLEPEGLTAEGLREVVHGMWSSRPQQP